MAKGRYVVVVPARADALWVMAGAGLSAQEAAERSGLSLGTVSRIRRGMAVMPPAWERFARVIEARLVLRAGLSPEAARARLVAIRGDDQLRVSRGARTDILP